MEYATHIIEELPNKVKSGEITKEQAARIIWTDIYMHPFDYGLLCFTEDQRSDFLLSIQKTFESLFEKFNQGQVSFKTFITGCLINQKNSFLRQQLKREHERRTLDTFLRSKGEEDTEKYANEVVSEYESVAKREYEKSSASENVKDFEAVVAQEVDTYEKKHQRIAELTALVLTMKACKDVDDDTISAVSDFTQIDKNLLYDKIQDLKQKMTQKNESYQTLVRRRNNAFYFHRKYMQEMASLTSTQKQIDELKKKYEGQTKKWQQKNQFLASVSDTPSNEEIAKSIGIKPRMVSFYINHAKIEENRLKIKRLYKKKTTQNQEDERTNENIQAKVAEKQENQ